MKFSNKLSYIIKSDFDHSTTMNQLCELLVCESLRFEIEQNTIRSVNIPFPILSFDYRVLSRNNWVGINPFVYVSNILLRVDSLDPNSCMVKVEIDQTRAIMIFWFVATMLLLVSAFLPNVIASISFLSIFLSLSGYLIFGLCVGTLIKKELNYVLKA